MATVKSLKSDVSSVSPWSEQLEELRVVRVYIELRYWWKYGDKKTRITQLNEKRSLIPWGLRVPTWVIYFCLRVLRLSELPRCRERSQTAICCLEWLRRLSVYRLIWMRSCHFFLRREGVLGHLVVFLFHQCITFCNKCKLCSRWHWRRCTWSDQWSLSYLLGLNFSSSLWLKGQVLHCERENFKVPGWSLIWNELLTKNLLMFLSRLNEISEVCLTCVETEWRISGIRLQTVSTKHVLPLHNFIFVIN